MSSTVTAGNRQCLDCAKEISSRNRSGRCKSCYTKHNRKGKNRVNDNASVASSAAPTECSSTPTSRQCKECAKKLAKTRRSERCPRCDKLRKDNDITDDEPKHSKCSECDVIMPTDSLSNRCSECEKKDKQLSTLSEKEESAKIEEVPDDSEKELASVEEKKAEEEASAKEDEPAEETETAEQEQASVKEEEPGKEERPECCQQCLMILKEPSATGLCYRCKGADNAYGSQSEAEEPEQTQCRDCGEMLPPFWERDLCVPCYARQESQPAPEKKPQKTCSSCGGSVPDGWTGRKCGSCTEDTDMRLQSPWGALRRSSTNAASEHSEGSDMHTAVDEDPIPSSTRPAVVASAAWQAAPDQPKCIDCNAAIAANATENRCLSCYKGQVDYMISSPGVNLTRPKSKNIVMPRQCRDCDTVIMSNTSNWCQECSPQQSPQPERNYIFEPTSTGTVTATPKPGRLNTCKGCGTPISPRIQNNRCFHCFTDIKQHSQKKKDLLANSSVDPGHADALLAACGVRGESAQYNSLVQTVISGVGLVPFDIEIDGSVVTALVHPGSLPQLTDYRSGEVSFRPSTAARAYRHELLAQRPIDLTSYKEIGSEEQELLNFSWINDSKAKYVTADLLSGCLLVVGEQVLKVHCLEPYGYRRDLDIHWERFGPTSKTSSGKEDYAAWFGRYSGIGIGTVLNEKNQPMLVIASLEGTFLVTASSRLDKTEPVCDVGPIITDFEPSRHARVYLSRRSLVSSCSLQKWYLYSHRNNSTQLRDVRSKFVHKSTYFLCRATSRTCSSALRRPYTIWTLADCTSITDDNILATAKIFSTVALSVLYNGNRLYKCDIEALLAIHEGEYKSFVQDILRIFKPGIEAIGVLKNHKLNRILCEAAMTLDLAIEEANLSIQRNMQEYFKHKGVTYHPQSYLVTDDDLDI